MSAAAPALPWPEANQRSLLSALAEVREALERHAAGTRGAATGPPTAPSLPPAGAPEAADPPAALDVLCSLFELSAFERATLLLCAGLELDARFAPACAAAQGDPARPHPTFGLALAALPDAHWSALTPSAPLRRWRLIELGPGGSLTAAPLRIDERILHWLTGLPQMDERLAGLVEPLPAAAPDPLPPSHADRARQLTELWHGCARATAPILQLCGGDPTGRRAVAAAACASLGAPAFGMAAILLPPGAGELDLLQRLWERESRLTGGVLVLDCDAPEAGDPVRGPAPRRWIENGRAPLILSAREPFRGLVRPMHTLELPRLDSSEQRELWRVELGASAAGLDGGLEPIVAQFDLGAPAIRSAARSGVARARSCAAGGEGPSPDREALARELWDACRVQARPRLEELAQRIDSRARWDDLVLPERAQQALRDMAAHVRQRVRVYETWGLGLRSARGLGTSALFSGPSGTGKTLAAEVLAAELGLDLYRIDLSQVVSKYIGETEKNLRRVFDAAEEGGAVLLFDEADALFGKRSEVKDSHDRFANIEVSYLLQRMEAYRGLAILTTNMKEALDPAFLRRLRFLVQFPFPDAAQRAEIWRRMFPPQTPTEGLDPERLARLNVPGGHIRNIALGAAFLAADAGEPVRMSHLLRAARSEYAKLDRPLTEAEIGAWS